MDYSERHLRRLRKKYEKDLKAALFDTQSTGKQSTTHQPSNAVENYNISSDTSMVPEFNSEFLQNNYDSEDYESEDENFYDEEDNDNKFWNRLKIECTRTGLLNSSQKTRPNARKMYSDGTLEMNSNFKDSCCLVDNVPFSIKKFVIVNGTKHIIGNRFTEPNDFFTRPVPSVDILGIFQVKKLSDIDEIHEESHIQYKFMALPYKDDGFVLIPILHFFQ